MSEATEEPGTIDADGRPKLGNPRGDRARRAAHEPAALRLRHLRPAVDMAAAAQPLLGVQDHRSVAAGAHGQVPGQHLDPLHPAHAAILRPAIPERPVLAAHRHPAAAGSQRQLHHLPGRGLVLRQRHHDERRSRADQHSVSRPSLPPAVDHDPELDRFPLGGPVRVRAGEGMVSGRRAGDQGVPAHLRRAEEPAQRACRGHLSFPGDDHHVHRAAAAGKSGPGRGAPGTSGRVDGACTGT